MLKPPKYFKQWGCQSNSIVCCELLVICHAFGRYHDRPVWDYLLFWLDFFSESKNSFEVAVCFIDT